MPEHNKDQEKTVRKFLFDLNRFDEPDAEPEPVEPPPPPPPTFSEDELAAAKAAAFEEGRTEGHRVAVQSREQLTANTLRGISESFSLLFAAEYDREKIYEQEAVRVALEALKKMFPILNARHGHEEVKETIIRVLQTRARQSAITIEVSVDDAPGVEALLAGHWADPESAPRYRILAQKDLNPGQCRLNWEDGGAVRDAADLADKITASVAALLGRDAPKRQNNAINEQDTDESTASATQTGENP